MMPRHVLLLGGSGFSGRTLAAALCSQDCRVSVMGRTPHAPAEPGGVQYFSGSLEHLHTLRALLPDVDAVVHLASASTPSTSSLDPSFETLHNVMPMARFLDVFAGFPDIPLIYISSGGAIYGNAVVDPVDEMQPLQPLSFYGAGKASIEALVRAFCHQAKRDALILRPSNFYGPGQIPRPGFALVPTLFQRALTDEPVDIWGDGNTVRDYLYIDDFVALVLRLLEQRPRGCLTYNVGVGEGTSVNAMCDAVERVTGKTLQRRHHPIRKVDVSRIVLDIRQVCRDTGWQPVFSLEQGLQRTWQALLHGASNVTSKRS